MLRSTVLCSAILVAAACYHGPSLKTFQPALGPQGIAAELHLQDTTITGELLEVQDTALIVRTDAGGVVLVPLVSIDWGRFAQRGILLGGDSGKTRGLPELRNLSRFPGGMTPEIRARLLAAYGQREIQVAR